MSNSIIAVLRIALIAIPVALFLGCSPSGEQSEATDDSASNFNTTLSVVDLMALVIDPAADSLWDNAGWIESAAGYEELYPTTDEGWAYVRAQSALVAETGNLLALPERAVDNDAWMEYAAAMSDAGLMAMDAAERQHQEDFFQAGAQLYSVCSACHQSYNPDIATRFVEGGPQGDAQ